VSVLQASDYVGAVRNNILAGGDQASRAHTVGALWGAQGGSAGIPEAWRLKVDKLKEIEALVDEMLVHRFRSV
jgi:ADP-ribosylglycohydrolase